MINHVLHNIQNYMVSKGWHLIRGWSPFSEHGGTEPSTWFFVLLQPAEALSLCVFRWWVRSGRWTSSGMFLWNASHLGQSSLQNGKNESAWNKLKMSLGSHKPLISWRIWWQYMFLILLDHEHERDEMPCWPSSGGWDFFHSIGWVVFQERFPHCSSVAVILYPKQVLLLFCKPMLEF